MESWTERQDAAEREREAETEAIGAGMHVYQRCEMLGGQGRRREDAGEKNSARVRPGAVLFLFLFLFLFLLLLLLLFLFLLLFLKLWNIRNLRFCCNVPVNLGALHTARSQPMSVDKATALACQTSITNRESRTRLNFEKGPRGDAVENTPPSPHQIRPLRGYGAVEPVASETALSYITCCNCCRIRRASK